MKENSSLYRVSELGSVKPKDTLDVMKSGPKDNSLCELLERNQVHHCNLCKGYWKCF